jgi:hypothetical protein
MPLAPIALFTFNRPEHTAATIAALSRNELAAESSLWAFSDGPRAGRPADPATIAAVRNLLRSARGFREVHVVERPENIGLSRSIIAGVTDLVSRYGRVIVLEDDIVTSPHFLSFMNSGLDRYEHDERVISIHGYVYPVSTVLPEAFFMRGADCWGWATWKRGWDLFEPDGSRLLRELKARGLEREFDMNGARAYVRMLEDQIAGRCDSWAIRWDAAAFLRDKLTLYPGVSLVRNIGLDNSGTHCGPAEHLAVPLADQPVDVRVDDVAPSPVGRRAFEQFFRGERSPAGSGWRAWWRRTRAALRLSSPP